LFPGFVFFINLIHILNNQIILPTPIYESMYVKKQNMFSPYKKKLCKSMRKQVIILYFTANTMASSPAPSPGVEPKPNITQLCFSICSMILLCGFINKSKHIKTATVTPTKFTHDQKRKRTGKLQIYDTTIQSFVFLSIVP